MKHCAKTMYCIIYKALYAHQILYALASQNAQFDLFICERALTALTAEQDVECKRSPAPS